MSHLPLLECAVMYPDVLASWIRMNPLLMPHIPQDKSDKTRESPTYRVLKELPIW